jgi:hypothetical protein
MEITGPEHSRVIKQKILEQFNMNLKEESCNKCKEKYCSHKCSQEAQEAHDLFCSSNQEIAEFYELCLQTESESSLFITKIFLQLCVQWKRGETSLWDALNRLCIVTNEHPRLPENEEWVLKNLQSKLPEDFVKKCNFEIRFCSFVDVTTANFFKLKSMIGLNSTAFKVNSVNFTAFIEKRENLNIKMSYPTVLEAVGLFSVASIMNHSCSPNVGIASPIFNIKSVPFVALKPIKEGEELRACYYEQKDVVKRREYLYHNYYFWCRCERCNADINKQL